MIAMRNLKSKEIWTEIKCPKCDGTGFPTVTQPKQPDRKIYPLPCKQCHGKGRIAAA
jgi:DnaJ-class molecular chaperone